MIDPVTEHCCRVRDQLVEKWGGLDGLFDRLEKLQLERDQAIAARRKPLHKPSTSRKPSHKKRTK